MKAEVKYSTTESGQYANKVFKGLGTFQKYFRYVTKVAKFANGDEQTRAEMVVTEPFNQTIGKLPIVGEFMDVIIADGKDEDGLTNLSNGRLANDYAGNNKRTRAYIHITHTMNNGGNTQASHQKIQQERIRERRARKENRLGTAGEQQVEIYFHENNCLENCGG